MGCTPIFRVYQKVPPARKVPYDPSILIPLGENGQTPWPDQGLTSVSKSTVACVLVRVLALPTKNAEPDLRVRLLKIVCPARNGISMLPGSSIRDAIQLGLRRGATHWIKRASNGQQ